MGEIKGDFSVTEFKQRVAPYLWLIEYLERLKEQGTSGTIEIPIHDGHLTRKIKQVKVVDLR